ncbi:MAG: hypothetical protein WBH03_14675, partial [Cyclobacteriaceae bacterium]
DLYNEPGDLSNEDEDSKVDLRDALTSKQATFLKYSLNGNLKLNGGFKVPNIGLQSEINQRIIFSSYRKHATNETFKEAFLGDITSFRFILNKNDVLALDEGEAVSMVLNGSLTFGVDFNWADAVTSSLTEISKLLKTADTIKMNLGASVRAKASVNISDNFNLSIQKAGDEFVVNLSRAGKNVLNASAGFSAGAQIQNPELIDEVIAKAFDKGEAAVMADADKLLNSLKQYGENQLTKSKLLTEVKNNADTLEKAAGMLGLDAKADDIKSDALKHLQAYKDKRDAIKSGISAVLNSKLELAGALTYSRTRTTDTVFGARLYASALEKYFGDIRFLNVDPLLQAHEKKESGVTLTEYKKVTQLIVSRGFAIGLNIAGWRVKLDVQKTNTLDTETVLDNSLVRFRVSDYSNERSATAMEGKNFQHLGNIQFNAKMPDLADSQSQASCDQFDYAFVLNYEEKHEKIKGKNEGQIRLRNMVDIANNFGILGDSDVEQVYEELWQKLKKQQTDFKVFLNVPYGQFENILTDLSQLDTPALATALSEALPYVKYDGRRTMAERRVAYGSYFQAYFNTNAGNITKQSIKQNMWEVLNQQYPTLATFENTFEDAGVNYGDMETKSVAYQLWDNNVSTDWDIFKERTLVPLRDNMTWHYKKVLLPESFRKASVVFPAQRELSMRFLARLILNLTAGKQITVEKGCSFTSGDEVIAYGEGVE